MLKRPSRLPREGFAATSRGKRLVSPHLSVSYVPGGGQAAAVVSKKVAAKAATRHLLKRRLLSIARSYVGGTSSFIIYARAGAAALPYARLKDEVTTLLGTLDS
jgi:ribonuclease P protein component